MIRKCIKHKYIIKKHVYLDRGQNGTAKIFFNYLKSNTLLFVSKTFYAFERCSSRLKIQSTSDVKYNYSNSFLF